MSDAIGMIGAIGYPMTATETMRDPLGLDATDTLAIVLAAWLLADRLGVEYGTALAIVEAMEGAK
jgi:hypothetical protein